MKIAGDRGRPDGKAQSPVQRWMEQERSNLEKEIQCGKCHYEKENFLGAEDLQKNMELYIQLGRRIL